MPDKIKFKNIGDLLDYEYLSGVIDTLNGSEDTCHVTIEGLMYFDVPIFYHCSEDSEVRSNGAIEGAAAGFQEEDRVIVLRKISNKQMLVIGHVEKARACDLHIRITCNGIAPTVPKLVRFEWENPETQQTEVIHTVSLTEKFWGISEEDTRYDVVKVPNNIQYPADFFLENIGASYEACDFSSYDSSLSDCSYPSAFYDCSGQLPLYSLLTSGIWNIITSRFSDDESCLAKTGMTRDNYKLYLIDLICPGLPLFHLWTLCESSDQDAVQINPELWAKEIPRYYGEIEEPPKIGDVFDFAGLKVLRRKIVSFSGYTPVSACSCALDYVLFNENDPFGTYRQSLGLLGVVRLLDKTRRLTHNQEPPLVPTSQSSAGGCPGDWVYSFYYSNPQGWSGLPREVESIIIKQNDRKDMAEPLFTPWEGAYLFANGLVGASPSEGGGGCEETHNDIETFRVIVDAIPVPIDRI